MTDPEEESLPRVTETLLDPRQRIAVASRMLARNGCESGIAGHVSERTADGFWVTPFAYFDEMTSDMVSRVGFDLRLSEGSWAPAAAVQFHRAIYEGRPDVCSIIHLHSHYVSVLSTLGRVVGMYNVASVLFHDEQVLHEDDGSRPPVDGPVIASALGDRRVVIVKNHGAIIASQSLERATIEAITLEAAARYHLEAEAAGGTELATAEVRRGRRSYEQYYLPLMWDANVRRLRVTDPEVFEE